MRRASRSALAIVSALFLVGVVAQFLLAGIGLFGAGPMQLHVDIGWGLHLVPVIILLLVWAARPGRRIVQLALGLFAVVAVQPLLPGLRETLPLVAALHPPIALAIFWLALLLTQRSVALARYAPAEPERPTVAQEA